jgi:hypothetical protein
MDYEFNKLTDVQQYFHGLKMTGGQYLMKEDDTPISLLGLENDKFAYYSPIHEKASTETPSDGVIRYKANMAHHRIMAMEYRQIWPEVKIFQKFKGKVQICWTHNRGTNCFTKVSFNVGNTFITSCDNAGIDVLNVTQRSKNMKDFHKRMGNIQGTEEWTETLVSDSTNPILPWWFSRSTGSFLPLFLFAPDVVNFDFEVRDKITSLLRMRTKEDDGSWRELSRDEIERDGMSYLEPMKEKLKPAECIFFYIDSLKDEIDRILNNPECNKDNQVYNFEYLFEDVIVGDADNDYKYGMDTTITPEIQFPSKFTVGLACNLQAESKNLYSNYTTSDSDVYGGNYPISMIKWQGPNNKSISFDLLTVSTYINLLLKKAPITNGYFIMPRSIRLDEIEDRNGISYKNNQIKFKISIEDTGSKKQDKNSTFKILTRSIVCRTFVFSYNYNSKKFNWSLDSQI